MNTQPHPRWNLPVLAAPVQPVPIEQSSTRADADELRIRVIAQSRITKRGKAAPLPTYEEAIQILATPSPARETTPA